MVNRHSFLRKGKTRRGQDHARHEDLVVDDYAAHESFRRQAESPGRTDQFREEDTLSRQEIDMNVGEFKEALAGGEERLVGRLLGREYHARVDSRLGGTVSVAQFLLIEHQGPHLAGKGQARLGIEAQAESDASMGNRDSAVSARTAIGVGDGANHRLRPDGSAVLAREQGKVGDAKLSQCLARTASPGPKLPPSLLHGGGDHCGFFGAKWLVFLTQRRRFHNNTWLPEEVDKTQRHRRR